MKEVLAFLIGLAFITVIIMISTYVPYGDLFVLGGSLGLMAWAIGSVFMTSWEMHKNGM